MSVGEAAPESAATHASGLLDQLFGLRGRTAIVTGASSGLGQRFAETLGNAGATVVPIARRIDRLASFFGDRDGYLPLQCDVTSPDDRARVVRTTLEEFGRIDVLVNNAGIGNEGAGTKDPIEAFQRIVDVDLAALFSFMLLVAEPMRAQGGGSIINISSVFGLVAGAPVDNAAYCAAKGGVISMTRQQGAKWIRRGIRVNSIAPGFFRTEMNAQRFATPKSRDLIENQLPIGRLGDLAELDGAMLYLAGSGSTYVTGQTLVIDGGWTAR